MKVCKADHGPEAVSVGVGVSRKSTWNPGPLLIAADGVEEAVGRPYYPWSVSEYLIRKIYAF